MKKTLSTAPITASVAVVMPLYGAQACYWMFRYIPYSVFFNLSQAAFFSEKCAICTEFGI